MHDKQAGPGIDHHLADTGLPFRAHRRIGQPAADEIAAGGWTVVVDAATDSGREIGAPLVLGLVELGNAQHLAAKRTVAALSRTIHHRGCRRSTAKHPEILLPSRSCS